MPEETFDPASLSRRERQILEILYRRGKATAAEVQEEMADEVTYSAVRGMLRVLAEKGLVQHRSDGVRYVFEPVVPREAAARSALDGLLNTFFGNSVEQVVTTLLSARERSIPVEELDRLHDLIERARREREG